MVENRWENGCSKQRVIATLGRLDRLQEKGQFDALLASGAKFAESVMVLSAHRQGETLTTTTRRMGPALLFERLWQELSDLPPLTVPVVKLLFAAPLGQPLHFVEA